MSSLSATQADGYYIPPEYYTSGQYKKRSLNQFNGSKGHNQFLQKGVVRFELPYDGFCIPCGAHVSRGTRFNAAKTKNGAYLTSPIYEFRMKCRICAAVEFVIRTNPKQQSFDYVSGIHKQVQEFDTVEAGTVGVIDTENGNRLVGSADRNSLLHLETVATGKRKAATERDALETLMKVNGKTFGEDVSNNAIIRKCFRSDRNEKKARVKEGVKLGWAEGMEVLSGDLLQDVILAKSTTFSDGKATEQQKFRQLKTASIFTSGGKPALEAIPATEPVPLQTLSTTNWGVLSPVEAAPKADDVTSLEQYNSSNHPTSAALSHKQKRTLMLNTAGGKVTIIGIEPPGISTSLDLLTAYGSDSD
jgi:coiled-coil domain-containing protein 130